MMRVALKPGEYLGTHAAAGMRITLMLGAVLFLPLMPMIAGERTLAAAEAAEKESYYCPMHPQFKSDKPGNCAICGMSLVKKQPEKRSQGQAGAGASPGKGERKVKFYRNPMNPEQTSPVPMKDEMGMEYIPVYEGEQKGVYISPESQQMIGVKTEKVQMRELGAAVTAVGTVAYDPGLFVAQEEFLQAVKTGERLGKDALPAVKERADSLIQAAKRKLLLLGMNEQGIAELETRGVPEDNLYLPGTGDKAWVYVTVYEYEIKMIKEQMPVTVTANAYPGETFRGTVSALAPVLNRDTRTLQVRAIVEDPQHKLRPEMYVTAVMQSDLGKKLAVPESAVLDTGVRKIVYVEKEANTFEQREIKTGNQARGYYEVLGGLEQGESVVTNGNFLIDSESRMKSSLDETGQ